MKIHCHDCHGPQLPIGIGIRLATVFLSFILTCLFSFSVRANESSPGKSVHAPLTSSPSPSDVLIVQLADGAEKEKFKQLLEEVNGKVVDVISAGTSLKFFIVQTEPGKASTVEKRFQNSKEVKSVERNRTYTINDWSNGLNQGTIAQVPSGTVYANHAGRIKLPVFRYRPIKFKLRPPQKGIPVYTPAAAPPPPAAPPKISGIPDDPFFSAQWDLSFMQYSGARLSGKPTGNAVVMYFLDTGITGFPGETASGVVQYDFSNPVSPTGAQEGLHDSGFHGTATSSVAATTDNLVGYSGMANFEGNRCIVVMCRISQDGQSASTVSILSALSFICNNQIYGPGPVNLSFGSPPPNTLNADPNIQSLAQVLTQKGSLLVLAAGNDGVTDSSPEQFARRVAAIGSNGILASFSETGPFFAAAPGVNVPVYTPSGPSVETLGSGTSFAAPRWCAAIADVMGVLSPAHRVATYADHFVTITAIITAQGWKVPNLQAAVQAAAGN